MTARWLLIPPDPLVIIPASMIKNTLGERPWNLNCGFCALHCGRTHKHTHHSETHALVLSCCSHYHVNKAKYSAIVPSQLLHLATSIGLALSSETHVLVCLPWALSAVWIVAPWPSAAVISRLDLCFKDCEWGPFALVWRGLNAEYTEYPLGLKSNQVFDLGRTYYSLTSDTDFF